MKQEFFPFVWNSDVTHQLRRYQIPINVSWNGTNFQQIFLEFMQYWNLMLLLPSKMC